ncbi:hypothetical protein DWY20_02790 [Phocaeicola coprocola]|uniref:Uncharacterized protein n=1 Tax=Phocaeicola coprocola TaxID=310298 RepID=A0A412GWI6_9BACT|nr:hypothetical protein DWY20_02790 [Phocaeicola coprocola]
MQTFIADLYRAWQIKNKKTARGVNYILIFVVKFADKIKKDAEFFIKKSASFFASCRTAAYAIP